jgi:hypothetical protein
MGIVSSAIYLFGGNVASMGALPAPQPSRFEQCFLAAVELVDNQHEVLADVAPKPHGDLFVYRY